LEAWLALRRAVEGCVALLEEVEARELHPPADMESRLVQHHLPADEEALLERSYLREAGLALQVEAGEEGSWGRDLAFQPQRQRALEA